MTLGRRSLLTGLATTILGRQHMADQLQRENVGAELAKFDRRLRALESTQRVATSSTASGVLVGPVNPTAYDGVEHTTALLGGSPVDLPSVNVAGAQFLVVVTFEMSGYGSSGLFAGRDPLVACKVDGTAPIGLIWGPIATTGLLTYETAALVCGVVAAPGSHTFQLALTITAGGGATACNWRNITLFVVPVSQQ